MGVYINGIKMGMPYINGIKHNAYINGAKIWNAAPTEMFKFTVQDNGSFDIPVSGVQGTSTSYQSYDWKINWGDGNIETSSGTGSNNATIPHTYTDGLNTHDIIIMPNGTATQGWFNAFSSSSYQDTTNLAKITQLYGSITPSMRTMGVYGYYLIFYNCTGLTSIPAGFLPATTLASYCYSSMFSNCTSLTTIPAGLLPATTLVNNCYSNMFYKCTSLTTLPANLLPATTLATSCYSSMFYDCTGLTSIPASLLPATTIAEACYTSMFRNCSSLVTIPAGLLPATTLEPSCYNIMFSGCTNLTTLPANLLQASTLKTNSYRYMFYNCTKLTNIGTINAAWFSGKLAQEVMFGLCTKINTPMMYASIPTGWK